MKVLYLYTTLGCHLCETCKSLLWPVLSARHIELQEVEISEKNALIERYGVRIPVVRLEGSEQDLGWPFTAEDLVRYLSATEADAK